MRGAAPPPLDAQAVAAQEPLKRSLPGILSRLNCAGQGCQDRDSCRRYRIVLGERNEASNRVVGEWASFDIERLVFGDCRAFVVYRAN